MADEVLDHAPNDLSPAELIVLLALALDARETDRVARFKSDRATIATRTRLAPSTVQNALNNLCARGLLCRRLEAHRGRSQEYEIAKLASHHRFNAVVKGNPHRSPIGTRKATSTSSQKPVDNSKTTREKGNL